MSILMKESFTCVRAIMFNMKLEDFRFYYTTAKGVLDDFESWLVSSKFNKM